MNNIFLNTAKVNCIQKNQKDLFIANFLSLTKPSSTYNRSFDIWQYSLHVLRRQSDLNRDLGSA